MKRLTETKSTGKTLFSTKQMVTLSLLSALAFVLMLIPLPFKYIGFLEMEFSDIPAIMAALAYGPLSGVIVELVKNSIKVITNTTTGGVGELANFLISAGYMLPLGFLYKRLKSRNKIILSFSGGIVGFIIAGILVNYFITVPLYATFYGGIDNIINLVSATIPAVHDLLTIVILGITPFNLVKGIIMSLAGYFVYKASHRVLI